MVIHYDAPVAIENFATWRNDGQSFNAVSLGQLVVQLRVPDLQIPKTRDQKQENSDGAVLEDGDSPGGEFRIIAQCRSRGTSVLGFPIEWKEIHGRPGLTIFY